jgi:hypothetical protein
MAGRQQTAPPQQRRSKDATAHPHQPGARPEPPHPDPAHSRRHQPAKAKVKFPLRNRIFVVVCLAVVTLPPRSTASTVAGCRLVGCSVVSRWPLRSRAVAGVSLHVCVGLGPVLASHAPSPPAAAAAAWLGRGLEELTTFSAREQKACQINQTERLTALLSPLDYTCSYKGMCTHKQVRTYISVPARGTSC